MMLNVSQSLFKDEESLSIVGETLSRDGEALSGGMG
jgi:hypothetical protein